MLILDKRLALERMVVLAERLHEAVPEPFKQVVAPYLLATPANAAWPARAPLWAGGAAVARAAPVAASGTH